MAPRHSRTPVTTTDTTRASVGVWTHAPTIVRRHVFVVRPGSEQSSAEDMSTRLTGLGGDAGLLGADETARVVVHAPGSDAGTVVALLDGGHPSDAAWCLDVFSDVSGFDAVPRGSAVVVFRTAGAPVELRTVARITEATIAPGRPARPAGPVARHARRSFGVDGGDAQSAPIEPVRSLVAQFPTARLEQISAGLGQTTVGDVVTTVVSAAVRRAVPAGADLVSTLQVADLPVPQSGTDTPDLHSFGPHVGEETRAVTTTVSRVGAATVVTLTCSAPALDLAAVLHHIQDELRAMERSAAAQFARLGRAPGRDRAHVNVAS